MAHGACLRAHLVTVALVGDRYRGNGPGRTREPETAEKQRIQDEADRYHQRPLSVSEQPSQEIEQERVTGEPDGGAVKRASPHQNTDAHDHQRECDDLLDPPDRGLERKRLARLRSHERVKPSAGGEHRDCRGYRGANTVWSEQRSCSWIRHRGSCWLAGSVDARPGGYSHAAAEIVTEYFSRRDRPFRSGERRVGTERPQRAGA